MAAKLLLCSCFVWGVFSYDETCTNFGTVQHDTDTSGELLAKIQAQSVDDCCALCSQRLDCDGYVFHLDQCYLKKNLGASTFKLHAMTRVKSACAGYAPPMPDVDMSGVLLAKLPAADMSQCCSLCDSTSGCEGYVFHLDQCYLKSGLASPSTKPGATTRLKYGSWSDASTQPGTEAPKRKCCGDQCYPDSPEYDPDTEQCCGEGEDMPVVCGLDVACPPLEILFGNRMPRLCPPKKRCCGIAGCNPSSPVYDPDTEQCCGGMNVFDPIVCSKESGCCLSGYTKFPQCFDASSEQCCGMNPHSEFPLVCSLDVACPRFLFYSTACPSLSTSVSLRGAATGSMATGANYSAAGPGEQLLP